MRLADGERAALRTVKGVKGGGRGAGIATGMVIAGFFSLGLLAPPFLLIHGRDAIVDEGTEITVYINGDIPLDPKKFSAKPANESQPPPPVGPAATPH